MCLVGFAFCSVLFETRASDKSFGKKSVLRSHEKKNVLQHAREPRRPPATKHASDILQRGVFFQIWVRRGKKSVNLAKMKLLLLLCSFFQR